MVKLDVITTRGGDKGETSLGDGTRLAKDAPRIEAIGAVDEANAALGLLSLLLAGAEAEMIARMQNDFFDIGADLCMPGTEGGLRITDAQCLRLEEEVRAMNGELPPLRSFVLPGGSEAAARAHLARTITRRAERACVSLAAHEPVNPAVIRYLNRASDHLFVLSRALNADAGGDVLWVPGGQR